jgi:hypothetical protein
MPKLSVKPKNWLLSGHVAAGGIWMGTSICMVVLALTSQGIGNGDELYAVHYMLKLFDDFIIIPAATLSAITGALLCWLTIWGFTKHYWVIVKWIATVTLITVGTAWLGPWVNAMTAISEVERLQALQNPLYIWDRDTLVIGSIVQTICLLVVLIISVVKPWGRRKIVDRPLNDH